MDFLIKKIKENLNEDLLKITISNPRKTEDIKKYSVRPILVKEQLIFQMEKYTKTQVFHENLDKETMGERIAEILPRYKQVQIQTINEDSTALLNKK